MSHDVEMASFIDHTLLSKDAPDRAIDQLCKEAVEYGFASVCVQLPHVERCSRNLQGTSVAVGTVISFPLGQDTTQEKVEQARAAASAGAVEIDVVINPDMVQSGRYDEALKELEAVVDAFEEATECLGVVKVIIETSRLTEEQKLKCTDVVARSGANFVKTSTGSFGGATVEDVQLLTAACPPHVGVKASGGIRTAEDAWKMIEAGADRIGTSNGVKIVQLPD